MTIDEPATLATDYLLAAVAIALARRLQQRTPRENLPARAWVWTLRLIAASAFVGGSFHGFAPDPPAGIFKLWWIATLWLISLTSAAMSVSWTHAVLRPPWRRIGFAFVAVRLVVFGAIAALRPSFGIVIIDYGSSLLLWLGAALLLRRTWSGAMLGGIALSVIAALVQMLHLAPSAQFNHNDLYHVLQMLALVPFYRAAEKLSPA